MPFTWKRHPTATTFVTLIDLCIAVGVEQL